MVSVLGVILLKRIFINYSVVLQKTALRIMFFAEPRTPAVPLFLETKQFPISFLLFEQMSLLTMSIIISLLITLRICSRNCLLSTVTGLDLLLMKITMLNKLELKI